MFFGLWGYWGYYYGDLLYLESGYDSLPIPWEGPFQDFCDWSIPAFLLTAGGRFLSVLGQIPLLAGAVLAGLSAGLFFLQRRIWPGRGNLSVFSSFIVLLGLFFLTILIPYHGYSLFGLAQCSLFFSYYIGLIAAFLLTLAVRKITTPKKRLIFLLLLGILLYPFFGFFALLTLFWMMLDFETGLHRPAEEAVSSKKRPAHFYGCRLILLAAVLLIPLLWFPLFYSHWDGNKIYSAGFLAVGRVPGGNLRFTGQILSGAIIGLMTLPILFNLLWSIFFSNKNCTQSKPDSSKRLFPLGNILSLFCLFLFLFAIVYYPIHERAFWAAVHSIRPLEEGNWDKILTLERKIPEPTLPLIELRQLALLRTGRAVNEYFDRPNMAYYSPSQDSCKDLDIYGAFFMFYRGIPNLAEWLAMELFTNGENRSPQSVEILTLCALVNGNSAMAEKYIDWLGRQIGRKHQAEDFRQVLNFLKTNGLMNPKDKLLPAQFVSFSTVLSKNDSQLNDRVLFWTKEVLNCRLQKPEIDTFENTQIPWMAACSAVLDQDWTEYPLEWLEMQLIYVMQMTQMDRFNKIFPTYYARLRTERPGEPIPKVLQQGAISLEFFETNRFPLKKYPYDPVLIRRFQSFLFVSERSGGAGPEFNDTWWKYLVDTRNQPQDQPVQEN